MVAILVRHRVPILDNGGTGLMDLGSDVDHCGILTAIVQVAIPDGMGL